METVKDSEENSDETKLKPSSGYLESVFVENVDSFMQMKENSNANEVIKKLNEQHREYKLKHLNLFYKKQKLKMQIPYLENCANMVELLQKKHEKGFETQFLLADQTFMKAFVPPTDKVVLTLGADILLEYTLDNASELLNKNIDVAKKNLSLVEDDLDFLRDQITTTEVNIARIVNWSVKQRQAAKTLECP